MSRIVKALEKSQKLRKTVADRVRPDDSTAMSRPIGRERIRVPAASRQNTLARFQLNMASFNSSAYKKGRIVLGESGAVARSAYNVLRTKILQRLRANNWNRLAISSAGPSEGKTLTAINLAISIARQGQQRVVLIDLDLQRPTVAKYLGLGDVENYLDEYIMGNVSEDAILHSTPIENFWIIPNSKSIENSSEVLSSDKTIQLLQWIHAIDPNCILLIDLPPILLSDDVLAILPQVDSLLLVMAEGRTTRESARNTCELIEEQKIDLIGTVLNKSSDRMAIYKY